MRLAALALSVLVGSGCATLVRGTRQEVAFSSSPPGVEVYDDLTGESWTGPQAIELERAYAHLLVISKEGYRPEMIQIRSQTHQGWMAAGILTLGISAILDSFLGGLYDLEPEQVYVVLERETSAVSQP